MPTTPNRRPINQNVDDARKILVMLGTRTPPRKHRGFWRSSLDVLALEAIKKAALRIIARNEPYDARRTPTKEKAKPYTTGAASKRAWGRKRT